MKTVDVIVSGRVQAVGFRAFTIRNAIMLGVKGYVENLGDGRVHAIFQGDDHQVEKLLELVRQGPRAAHVREIKVKETDDREFAGFEVR